MRSSDQTPRGAGSSFRWLVVVGNALLGTALTLLALAMLGAPDGWTTTTSLLVAVVGVLWVAVGSVGFHRMFVRRPPLDGRRVTVGADGRSVVLEWSTTLLRVPALSVAGLVVVLLVAGLALLGDGSAWLFLGSAALLALLLPDSWARLRRAHRLVLDPQGVTAYGWDGDAHLDWDDVVEVRLVDVQFWSTLRVVGRPGAPSFRWVPRRRILFAPRPRGPFVDIPGPAVDVHPFFLAGTLEHYARTPSARRELGDGTARMRLVELVRPGA